MQSLVMPRTKVVDAAVAPGTKEVGVTLESGEPPRFDALICSE